MSHQRGFGHLLLFLIIGVAAFIVVLKLYPHFIQSSPKQTAAIVTPISTATLSAQLQKDELNKYLVVETALLGVNDTASVFFKDLATNTQVSINPTKPWIPASTIKSFVVLEAYRQKRLGLIDFNQTVTIKAQNVVPTELETDEFPRLREGTQATIRQLVEAMIIQSDNTAYNTLLDILDRRNINSSLRSLGITETVVGEKLNLDDNQFQEDQKVPGRQPNTTTVEDLATFFNLLYDHKIADSDEIISIFKRQKINNMIPVFLPPNTQIAHKTGDWAPIYHDGGVVYKPNDPFILTVFTNSGDPTVISDIAKVAYYQNVDSVGKDNNPPNDQKQTLDDTDQPVISLADNSSPTQVLGTANDPTLSITASDLGITEKDLNPDTQEVSDIGQAWITPGSLFYKVKQYIEGIQLNAARSDSDKAAVLLSLSKNRLVEAKTFISQGKIEDANIILQQSESDLKQATDLAENTQNKDEILAEAKKINDLHYAVLADQSQKIDSTQRKQFIDAVYNFYQKNHTEVVPTINSTVITDPTHQSPAIGTIKSIQGNHTTVIFDDGTIKQMVIPQDTRVRSFQQNSYSSGNSLTVGDKIAIVGQTDSRSEIIPQFILKSVPKELPSKEKGTVIEINPSQKTLKILDQKGQEVIIQINSDTLLKSSDTNVSIGGITAGSQITVYGTRDTSKSPNASPSILPSSSQTPTSNPSSNQDNQTITLPKNDTSQSQSNTVTNTTVIQLKATTITVTTNSSGSKEVVKQENHNSPPAAQSQPQQNHTKGDNKSENRSGKH